MMKRISDACLLLALLLSVNILHAQPNSAGIQFFEGSWDELLKMAQKTDKPIFIDVYTDWCGPCKMMAKNIFPMEKVGNTFNAGFVNYKLNAEKGEGVALAKKYNVDAYPTFLFLRNNGEIVHRATGYDPSPDKFISEGKTAIEFAKDTISINTMGEIYKNGRKDTAFLVSYISRLGKLGLDNSEPLDDYLEVITGKEPLSGPQLQFLFDNVSNAGAKTFSYLLENGKTILDDSILNGVSYKMINLLQMGIAIGLRDKELPRVRLLLNQAAKMKLQEWDVDAFKRGELEYYYKAGYMDSLVAAVNAYASKAEHVSDAAVIAEDKKRFNEFMKPYLENKTDSLSDDYFRESKEYMKHSYGSMLSNELFTAASYMNKGTDDKQLLARALGWSERALKLEPQNYRAHAVLAKLNNRLGKNSRAAEHYKQAIAIAKKQSDKTAVKDYETELAKIK